MKKIVLFCILFFTTTPLFAFSEVWITQAIDNIFLEKQAQLQVINPQLPQLAKKYSWDKKDFVNFIYDYLNYKFQNDVFYSEDIPSQLQVKIQILNTRSFTWQELIQYLKNLQKEYKYWEIEYEFIEYNILLTEVWLLLNHQDFDQAKEISQGYFINNSAKAHFIIQHSSYSVFNSLSNLLKWNKIDTSTLLETRWGYFPQEKSTAYNSVQQNNSSYEGLDCSNLTILNKSIDLIELSFCKLFNGQFESSDLDKIDSLDNNIQNLSDRINYYSYVQTNDLYYNDMLQKKESLGKKILERDINFINWYMSLLDIYDVQNNCDKFNDYFSLLEENYIWDETRRENVFWRQYLNCWK